MQEEYTPDVPTKQCPKCKEFKPATTDCFSRSKSRKDGFSFYCKKCQAEAFQRRYAIKKVEILERARENRKAHPEKDAEYKKRYIDKNREKFLDGKRKRYAANKENSSVYFKKYRKDNREKRNEYNKKYDQAHRDQRRDYHRKHYELNKERIAKYHHEYKKSNTAKTNVDTQRRRARKISLPDNFTADDWQRSLDYFKGCCAACDRPIFGIFHTAHADHWIPLSNPACIGTVPENMVPLCGGIDGCNQSKNNRNAKEWLLEKFGKRKASVIEKRIEAYFEHVRSHR